MAFYDSTQLGKDPNLGHGDAFAPEAEGTFTGTATTFLPPWIDPTWTGVSQDIEYNPPAVAADPLLMGLLALAAYLWLT